MTMKDFPSYSVAIRTLGKSGDLFVRLIQSLKAQTLPPEGIFVYIAEGYPLPERIADEQYICCPKGMVAQRSLPFDEIGSAYILFCDDDMEFAEDSVERLMRALLDNHGDCISHNAYPNHLWSLREKLGQAFYHGIFPTLNRKYAFKVRRSSRYSYCARPRAVMRSQSCAGSVILINASVYRKLHFEDEVWMDSFAYALGDDQMFSYKLYKKGFTLLVHFDSGITHNDGRTGRINNESLSDYTSRVLRYVIWYRSVYQADKRMFSKFLDCLAFYCDWCWMTTVAMIETVFKHKAYKLANSFAALSVAKRYVRSEEFISIPQWNEKNDLI